MDTIKKNDFIEIEFIGFHEGKVFDTNIPEELKKLNPEAKAEKTIIVVGKEMVVSGLDKAFEGKEVGKEFEVDVPYREGFGERKRELVKTIPLHVFHRHKIDPKPGETLILDNAVARIITISGARVVTDFNNPMSGKDLKYKVKIIKKIDDEKEKVKSLFEYYYKIIPEFEIKDGKIVIKGPQKLEQLLPMYHDKLKDMLKKEVVFEKKEKSIEEIVDQDKNPKVVETQ